MFRGKLLKSAGPLNRISNKKNFFYLIKVVWQLKKEGKSNEQKLVCQKRNAILSCLSHWMDPGSSLICLLHLYLPGYRQPFSFGKRYPQTLRT